MQFLIDLAAEDGDIRRLSEFATQFATVQGIVLDVDPFWLDSWTLLESVGERTLQERVRGWIQWAWHHHGPGFMPLASFIGGASYSRIPPHRLYLRPLTLQALLKWRPPFWGEYSYFAGFPEDPRALPIIVKVCVRPSTEKEEIPTAEALQERSNRFRVVIEVRTQAVLAANPRRKVSPLVGGVSIGKVGSTEFGTLGVILSDAGGKPFAITCSHVIDQQKIDVVQPSQGDSPKALPFGKRVAGTALQSCLGTAPCNPWSGTTTNEEDIALIEIDKSKTATALQILSIGALNGIVPRASISNGQSVEVMGRTTKHSYLAVGGLAAWYRMAHHGSFYCFKNLFEVQSPYGRPGSVKGGDSGAPVCTAQGAGNGWCGMIVGCDALKGYAMYSETIATWWKSNKYSLSVV